MIFVKKLIVPLIYLCCALALTGCGTLTLNEYSQDIARLELVQTIGVDLGEQGAKVTAGIRNNDETKAISSDSASVVGALEKLHSYSAKERVFLAHTKHYILGEQAARNGVSEYLDFIERNMNMRINTPMFIVKGTDAHELMANTEEDATDISTTLETLEKSLYLLTEGYVFTCADVARNLLENGCALVAAIEAGESSENNDNAVAAVPAGYAILMDGKLIDFIDAELVGGVNIFMKKMNPDVLEVRDEDGKIMAFQLSVDDVDYKPVYEGYDLKSVIVNVDLKAGIEEVGGKIDINDTDVLDDLSGKISQIMSGMGHEVLKKSQELEIDFLNIKKKVEIKSPNKFSKMEKSWEQVFPGIDIDLRVSTEIERTYDLKEPVGVSGESYGE